MALNDPRLQAIYDAGAAEERKRAAAAYQSQLQQAIAALRHEQEQNQNRLAGGLRKQINEQLERSSRQLSDIARIADALKMTREAPVTDRPGILRVENMPGQRVPFTYLVDIYIEADTTSVRSNSITISQDGPFVAVKRIATFQSAFEFQVENPLTGGLSRLAGRSYGRYRPIHSAGDTVDSQHFSRADTVAWFTAASVGPPAAGTPLPTATLGQPNSMSSFRTMEFDGRIVIENAGSSYPRQNIPVPTSMWTPHTNAPWELACLDFFERGEVISFNVQPTHVNNPAAGNADGENVFPRAAAAGLVGYPFLAGQFDAHEGIATPNGVEMGDGGTVNDWDPLVTDPISRLPNGILTLGFEGYRIRQGTGASV